MNECLSVGLKYGKAGAVMGLILGFLFALLSTAIAVVIQLEVWLVCIFGTTLVCAVIGFISGFVAIAICNAVER